MFTSGLFAMRIITANESQRVFPSDAVCVLTLNREPWNLDLGSSPSCSCGERVYHSAALCREIDERVQPSDHFADKRLPFLLVRRKRQAALR